MRVAAALHTMRQHFTPGCLLTELGAGGHAGREKRLAGLHDAPVRVLECKERKAKVCSVDHEGGSCPAHRQATSEDIACKQS